MLGVCLNTSSSTPSSTSSENLGVKDKVSGEQSQVGNRKDTDFAWNQGEDKEG